MLFLLASPHHYVPRYSLSKWQRVKHPFAARRLRAYQRQLSDQNHHSMHLAKADDLLGRIEFGRDLSAGERHFVRQQRLKHHLSSHQVQLAIAGTGLRQSRGRLHIWKQPRWLLWVAGFAQATFMLLAISAVLGTIWSVVDSGNVIRSTYTFTIFSIYFIWMTAMARTLGIEWHQAQQLRDLMSVERVCSISRDRRKRHSVSVQDETCNSADQCSS